MRAAVQFPMLSSLFYASQTRAESYVAWVRDHLLSVLCPGASYLNYRVSDIFKWQGTTASYFSYAFIVEERDGAGVPTGNQWMLVFPYYTATGNTSLSSFLQSYSSYTRYAGREVDTNVNDPFMVFYIPEGGTRRSKLTVAVSGGSFTTGVTIRNAGSTKFGIIRSITGAGPYEWEVEHTVGLGWTASEGVVDNADPGTNTATITTEDWRSFVNAGWDDFDALSLSGGDHSALATSPYATANTPGFLPKVGAGASFVNFRGRYHYGDGASYHSLIQMVFDNTIGFLCHYVSNARNYADPRDILISGDIFENADGSTVYTKGTFGLSQISTTAINGPTTDFQFIEAQYYGGGAGTAGALASFSYRGHENFTLWNNVLPTTPQTYAEARAYVYNTNEAKAWVKPTIARVQGPDHHGYGLITNRGGVGQNVCIKVSDQLMTPWVTNRIFGQPDYTLGTAWPPLHLWS